MSLVVPNEGEIEILTRAFKRENSALRLYTNDYTPVKTSTVSSFTEATTSGYAAKTLASGSWNISTSGTLSYAEQEFINIATMSGYGYYVTNAGNTTALWAERFTDGPYVITSSGQSIKITLNITVS